MNKKNITIDTEFFDSGIEAKLKAYHTDEALTESGRKSQTMVEHYRRASYDNGVPNPRYQYVPDNQYSTGYDVYEMPPQTIKKLQAANNFQNIISRAMANLFVRCWEQIKALLPQYSHLVQQVQQNQPKKINQQVLQDYNNVFNNEPSQVDQNLKVHQANVFSKKNQHLDERKNQIIQRQMKGLTLDSLSKQKLNRSKSTKKQEGTIKTQQNIGKNQRLVQSRKCYRQKFLQYKHRSKSRDLGLQKSLTYTKFSSSIPFERQPNVTSIGHAEQYPTMNHVSSNIRNVHSTSNISHSKNQILRNMKDILMDRQDIYQGQKYNYYVNHRDSLRNAFSYETQSYQRPQSYSTKLQNNPSTQFDSYQNQEEFMIRTQLIQQIVQKLNFSKLRLDEIQKPRNEEQQIMKRIDKLQQIILSLKDQQKVQYNRPQQQHQIIHHKIQQCTTNQSQNLETYKKFIDQIASLRYEIKEIRNIKTSEPQKIVIKDNSSSHIIFQQQKLLSSYQQEFQKLMSEKERMTNKTQKKPQILQTEKKSIFDQLIENGKNSQNKETWNEGWETSNTGKKLHKQNLTQQNQKNQQTIRKSRRTQHFDRDDGFQKYRYTRNQVLQNIGLRGQVQEQQRLWRQEQARTQFQRQRRDQQVRIMVQNVRRQRIQLANSQNIDRQNLTRQKYEQQWQRYNNLHNDHKQSSSPYCSLFQC